MGGGGWVDCLADWLTYTYPHATHTIKGVGAQAEDGDRELRGGGHRAGGQGKSHVDDGSVVVYK